MSVRDVYSFYAETIRVGPGVTLTLMPIPGQLGVICKYVSGGSLNVVGFSNAYGTTYAISNLYTVQDGEILSLDCSGYISFIATGATCTFSVIRSRSSGFSPGT